MSHVTFVRLVISSSQCILSRGQSVKGSFAGASRLGRLALFLCNSFRSSLGIFFSWTGFLASGEVFCFQRILLLTLFFLSFFLSIDPLFVRVGQCVGTWEARNLLPEFDSVIHAPRSFSRSARLVPLLPTNGSGRRGFSDSSPNICTPSKPFPLHRPPPPLPTSFSRGVASLFVSQRAASMAPTYFIRNWLPPHAARPFLTFLCSPEVISLPRA